MRDENIEKKHIIIVIKFFCHHTIWLNDFLWFPRRESKGGNWDCTITTREDRVAGLIDETNTLFSTDNYNYKKKTEVFVMTSEPYDTC